MAGRRCICGRSGRLPLCDGSHAAEGWTCAALPGAALARVFAAAPHNHTLAERLAHVRRGQPLHRLDGPVVAEELVVLTDGTDLDHLRPALARLQAGTTRVLVVGADVGLLAAAFPGSRLTWVPEADHPAVLWTALLRALDDPGAPVPPAVRRLFLSHATADEARIQPAVTALRDLGLEVFVCGDSIPAGSRWWDEIRAALQACDRFLLVLSAASRDSGWCAFEAGAAVAWDKPVQLISLDGTLPPSYLAHLHMLDLPRAQRLRPWLDDEDALIEALIAPLAAPR